MPTSNTSTRCPECGQTDQGQTGEYPCGKCGLTTDNATLRARVEKLEKVREAAVASEQITRVVLNALHRDWAENGKREEIYKELRDVFGGVCIALAGCEEVGNG